MSLIKNASPQVIFLGADDKSGRKLTPTPEQAPQHCPLFFVWTRKGPTNRLLVSSGKLSNIYGKESFDTNDIYYNHQTRYLTGVTQQGNSCIIQRIVPDDANVRANLTIYADVLEKDIPNYLRNSDGSIAIDADTGKSKINPNKPKIKGSVIKFIKEFNTDPAKDKEDLGKLSKKAGTMEESITVIPEIKTARDIIIKNLPSKVALDTEVPVYENESSQTDTFCNVIPVNSNLVRLNDSKTKWITKAPGTTRINFTLSGQDESFDRNTLSWTMVVSANDVLPTRELTIDGIKTLLTKENNVMQLVFNTIDVDEVVVTVSDPTVLSYDSEDKTITGLANGTAFVTATLPPTDTNEGVSWIWTVQCKVKDLEPIVTKNRSTMYPIFQTRAMYPGEYYNNIGFSIGSMFGDEVYDKILTNTESLPYRLMLYTRPSSIYSPEVLRTIFGEPSAVFSLKELATNPTTEARFDLETIFRDEWFNESDYNKPLRFKEYENFYFYKNEYEKLIKKLLENEFEYISETDVEWNDGISLPNKDWFDMKSKDDVYLMNIFGFKSTKMIPYFTVQRALESSTLCPNQKEVMFSNDTPIFLEGGKDGTINDENFEKRVMREMAKYADPNSEVHDLAINVESIIYDSGFSLPCKKELINFIALRKDTVVILSTHEDRMGDKDLKLSDARAVAVALKNRYKLAPESEYFGTAVARGVVMVGTGKMRNSVDPKRIPLTYELAIKAARMMGNSNGKWNAAAMFDNYPGNLLEFLNDPTPAFIPAGIKPTLWNDGIVWVQPYDRSSYHIPAIQTVYDNDTSVLNNFFVMMSLSYLTKSADRTWRRFTGTSSMTSDEFKEAVTAFASEEVKDKFAGIVTVHPEADVTEEDRKRGYSWRLIHRIYGANMKTLMVHHSEVYRSDDLDR